MRKISKIFKMSTMCSRASNAKVISTDHTCSRRGQGFEPKGRRNYDATQLCSISVCDKLLQHCAARWLLRKRNQHATRWWWWWSCCGSGTSSGTSCWCWSMRTAPFVRLARTCFPTTVMRAVRAIVRLLGVLLFLPISSSPAELAHDVILLCHMSASS